MTMSTEALRQDIADQRCPWCGATHGARGKPLIVLAKHTQEAHGITSRELKRLAGYMVKDRVCDPTVSDSRRLDPPRVKPRDDMTICPRCLTRPRRRTASGGMKGLCGPCLWPAANREKNREAQERYRAAHPEKVREAHAKYYAARKQSLAERNPA